MGEIMDRVIQIGKKYKHFKGKMYKVLDIVYDSESNNDDEYKALYAIQTSYAIIVKAIAYKVLSKICLNIDARTVSA